MAGKLALIAHDHKKVDLVAWATFNRETLAAFSLVATRHTARLVRHKVGLEVEELLSGPEGGDAQIAAGVAIRQIDAVFFFVDPL
jgi:methylglyoxal synthase